MTTDELVKRLTQVNAIEAARVLARQNGVTLDQVATRLRSGAVRRTRREIWSWIYTTRGLSYPDIGKLFERDHTTIMSGIRQARRRARAITVAA